MSQFRDTTYHNSQVLTDHSRSNVQTFFLRRATGPSSYGTSLLPSFSLSLPSSRHPAGFHFNPLPSVPSSKFLNPPSSISVARIEFQWYQLQYFSFVESRHTIHAGLVQSMSSTSWEISRTNRSCESTPPWSSTNQGLLLRSSSRVQSG